MHWYDLPDLLPPVYRNIKSMFATADAENIELQRFRAFVTRIMDNFFVQTCDVQTIEYWEALLDIKLYGNPTLDERREMILLHLNNSDPITDPFVKQVMHNLFGKTTTHLNQPMNIHWRTLLRWTIPIMYTLKDFWIGSIRYAQHTLHLTFRI